MSRFRFRLERVLRARRTVEEVQRLQVALAETAARSLEEVAAQRTQDTRAAQASLRDEQSAAALDAARVLRTQEAVERVRAVESLACERAEAARHAADLELATWKGMRADVRGLERLEERARLRFVEEINTQEERAIEEAASRRAEQARFKVARP